MSQVWSKTTTSAAPAARQSFTIAPISCGLVSAANSGALSQPMFGFTTTLSPLLMNLLMPPISAMPFLYIASGVLPITATSWLDASAKASASSEPEVAAAPAADEPAAVPAAALFIPVAVAKEPRMAARIKSLLSIIAVFAKLCCVVLFESWLYLNMCAI